LVECCSGFPWIQILILQGFGLHQEKKKLHPERPDALDALDAAVSGHFHSGRSRVRAFSFWTQLCQGKWCLDDACHGTAVTLAVKVWNIAANTLVAFATRSGFQA